MPLWPFVLLEVRVGLLVRIFQGSGAGRPSANIDEVLEGVVSRVRFVIIDEIFIHPESHWDLKSLLSIRIDINISSLVYKVMSANAF